MSRYFLEVSYKGTAYSGFQSQQNANTIQAEVEKAFHIIQRIKAGSQQVMFTGSSRTDAGVHALQNFFHFDIEGDLHPQLAYKLNALLPRDIAIQRLVPVAADAHCRFDAVSRRYTYRIHRRKSPFLTETSFYYPYNIDEQLLHEAAAFIASQQDFFSFAKTNTQVKNFRCNIIEMEWQVSADQILFTIEANRFLRGMVRLITATCLKVARGRFSMESLQELFEEKKKSGFSVPPQGLFLEGVNFPEGYFSL